MLSVLVLNDYATMNGGASAVAIGSSVGLAERGHRVMFFHAAGEVDPALRRAGVSVISTGQADLLNAPAPVAAIQGIWNAGARARLQRELQVLDPKKTVCHVHSWTKALSASIFPLVRQAGIPIVVTLHDYFVACPNGGFFNFPRATKCGLAPMSLACVCSNCDSRSYSHKLWRVMRQAWQEQVFHFPSEVKFFISVSDHSLEILRPFLPLQASIFKVSNPINIERQPPVAAGGNSYFTMVGRLAPEKGALLLTSAATEATPLLFVGDGSLAARILLESPWARVTGWLTPDQVRAALRATRVLVFPSLWHETQGLVVAEAAAMGIPAIVSDGSAARDLVVDGETGLYFRNGDVNDLARKIELLRDDARVSRMGTAAYDHYWRSAATLDRHVEELSVCYSKMLTRRECPSFSSSSGED